MVVGQDLTRVGQHQARVGEQPKHLEISLRREKCNAFAADNRRQTKALDIGPGPGMNGPYQGQLGCDLAENSNRLPERRGLVDIGGPVQCNDTKARRIIEKTRRYAFAPERFGRRDSPFPVLQQGIDHHVADKANAIRRDPFPGEILRRAAFGRIEQIRNLIGEDAIDLFGHAAVVAAQPRFDMNNGNQPLACNQAARQG